MSCISVTASLLSSTAVVSAHRSGDVVTPRAWDVSTRMVASATLVCDVDLGYIALQSADGFILYDKNNYKLVLEDGKLQT